jgi:hypothetical protein
VYSPAERRAPTGEAGVEDHQMAAQRRAPIETTQAVEESWLLDLARNHNRTSTGAPSIAYPRPNTTWASRRFDLANLGGQNSTRSDSSRMLRPRTNRRSPKCVVREAESLDRPASRFQDPGYPACNKRRSPAVCDNRRAKAAHKGVCSFSQWRQTRAAAGIFRTSKCKSVAINVDIRNVLP